MNRKIILLSVCCLLLALCLPLGAAAREPELTAEAEILNAAELSPTQTGIAELDALVAETVGSLVEDDQDTYGKVKACYDYLLENMRYDSSMRHLDVPVGDTTCADIFYTYGEVEGFGAVALSSNYGLCNGYAAGFILMARHIGLEARLVTGGTLGAGGGYSHHKWAEIEIGGETYVFDPQLDQNVESWGLPAYTCFCKTYAQMGGRYQK